MARSWSKSEVELLLSRNTGEGGEGTSPSAGANTNASRSVLPLPSPAPLLRKSTYHHPVSRMKRRHASTGTGEEGRWVYKGRAALVDLEVAVYPTPFPSHFAPEAAGRTHTSHLRALARAWVGSV
ncbi:hypothetical protein DFH08DRAFT_971075 [Mycena albidolilacea]|uniref:Uncharacterized protein n=1 Tax=Mycena albidolilacea TaxID=1033008 RepID=A0AAD7EG34_9AGAR|nr:hypothetical protein DFH08DRAFT_971075 [Mycena albidolilacea]